MKRIRSVGLILALLTMSAGLLIGACGSDSSHAQQTPGLHGDASAAPALQAAHSPNGKSAAAAAFHDQMRKLWEDHITWTRLFIVSTAASLPDLQATTARLLQNQADIGDAIKPFYGDAVASQLTSLLRSHITTAADLLAAAKAGDSAGVKTAGDRWYANADEIAAFLNGANPTKWPLADMKTMMKEHLDLTLAEATARLQGNYAGDVAAYDSIHHQILGMADMLSAGVEAQFPERFR